MHLGNLTSTGLSNSKNLIHIILNNAAHDSVGGQPTCGNEVDIPLIAEACGYSSVIAMSKLDEVRNYIKQIKKQPGPHLIELKVKKGSRGDLGRPTSSPVQNKEALMENIW